MNSKQFLKEGFSTKSSKFFNGFIPLKEVTYNIVIIYDNNYKKEVYGINNPWKFIASLKKNPRVKNIFIKDENNP